MSALWAAGSVFLAEVFQSLLGVGCHKDGVRGWITPYSTLCGVSVTGVASLVAECGTNILLKKCQQSLFVNPFLGHFQKSVTGSESMSRFVMASTVCPTKVAQ